MGAGLIVLAVLVVVAAKWILDNTDAPWSLVAPNEQTAVLTKMIKLRDEGQFEEAVNVRLHATSGNPDDDFIYQLIAKTYFIRSLHDRYRSGDWAKLGAEYSQKALDANPKDIANVFNVGLNYVAAGDDLDTGGCEYYLRAKAIFENLALLLNGDHAETQGRTVPWRHSEGATGRLSR